MYAELLIDNAFTSHDLLTLAAKTLLEEKREAISLTQFKF